VDDDVVDNANGGSTTSDGSTPDARDSPHPSCPSP
jgi:hypothetical protein